MASISSAEKSLLDFQRHACRHREGYERVAIDGILFWKIVIVPYCDCFSNKSK